MGRYVVMGVAGAGKSLIGSALARALGVNFVEGDAYHPPENVARMAAGIPLSDDDRLGWLQALAHQLGDAAAADEGLVMACSALKRSYRDLLRVGDPSVRFILLHGSETLLAKRLAARRGHYMPASLLGSQLATLEVPGADEGAWRCDIGQSPDAIVATLVTLVTRSTA
jgi:carbohydrate kinase, thermoresistant glucokinase family